MAVRQPAPRGGARPPAGDVAHATRSDGRRRIVAGIAAGALAGGLVAACSSPSSPNGATSTTAAPSNAHKPVRTIPAAAGLAAIGAPQPNGVIWTLVKVPGAANLEEIQLTDGKPAMTVPESVDAVDVVQSSTGELAVGVATATTGSLELRNGGSASLTATVPIGAPVRRVAVGGDGKTFYVLDGNSTSMSVSVVDASTHSITKTIPVPLDSLDVVPSADQSSLYVLTGTPTGTTTGTVDQVVVATGKAEGHFVVGPGPICLAISPAGDLLYVLKGTGSIRNTAVVDLATESVSKVLPAPEAANDVQVDADGTEIYVAAGTETYGNIQVFATG